MADPLSEVTQLLYHAHTNNLPARWSSQRQEPRCPATRPRKSSPVHTIRKPAHRCLESKELGRCEDAKNPCARQKCIFCKSAVDGQTAKTSQQAIAALINLSSREEALRALLIDDPFLEYLHSIITDKANEQADLVCMLLSNLVKSPHIETLLALKVPEVKGLQEKSVAGQLMEVFVLGENKKWNHYANFDFLANVWGDLTRVSSRGIRLTGSFQKLGSIY
jgi:hypothetical protein